LPATPRKARRASLRRFRKLRIESTIPGLPSEPARGKILTESRV
jgi:hypothetical protein